MQKDTVIGVLSPAQKRALPYVVACSSITEAARQARTTRCTIHRWLRTSDDFRNAVRSHRQALADMALGAVRNHVGDAVTTLAELLKSDHDSVRRGAARDILDLCLRLREIDELEDRLAALEQQLARDTAAGTRRRY